MPSNVSWAKSDAAQATGEAISALLDANRKSSRTVQWMPEGEGCRFEIIHRDGTLLGVARVAADGAVRLEGQS